jgi:ParB-like chromosome segregation protein Spo0J
MSDESLDFTTMRWHPAAEAWEMLPEKKSKKSVYSLEELAESIRQNGLMHPIKYWQDPADNKFWKIDGRNREAACRLAGVKPRYTQVRLPGDVNVVEYVKTVNGDRRHLNASQKAMAAAKLVPILAAEVARTEKARKRAGSAPTGEKHGRSAAAQAGAVTGASERNVQDAALIERKDPDLAKKVAAGEVTIHQAKREVVRREKEESLRAAAEAVGPPAEGETWAVAAGSSPGALDELESESADLILLDPPYNQGVDYGGGAKADRLADDDYLAFVNSVVESCVALLAPASSSAPTSTPTTSASSSGRAGCTAAPGSSGTRRSAPTRRTTSTAPAATSFTASKTPKSSPSTRPSSTARRPARPSTTTAARPRPANCGTTCG